MELLIKKGAIIDSTNRGRCTPLHVAVNKQFPACVHILLKYGCDVNVQVSPSKVKDNVKNKSIFKNIFIRIHTVILHYMMRLARKIPILSKF